jgi:hypothetical protein
MVPLSAAYIARQELLAAGVVLYLAGSELWHRFDFGDDITPKPYKSPYPDGVDIIGMDELSTVMLGLEKPTDAIAI